MCKCGGVADGGPGRPAAIVVAQHASGDASVTALVRSLQQLSYTLSSMQEAAVVCLTHVKEYDPFHDGRPHLPCVPHRVVLKDTAEASVSCGV